MARSLIGPRIRERRRARGLSQTRLAAEVGISASYLNLIEHNKRGIAGKTLNAIARRLEIEPQALAEGADAALVDSLDQAAAVAGGRAERDRVAEMVGRFPGWARMLAALARRVEDQERSITALSDRLTHDPYLAESMHLMLSAVTAVQSTTDILAEADDLTAEQRARFTGNLQQEGRRLSGIAREMVAYFDRPNAAATAEEDLASRIESFWSECGHFSPELEAGPSAVRPTLGRLGAFARSADRDEATRALERYARIAARLPLQPFLEAAKALRHDAVALAARLDAKVEDILFRLAHLPADPKTPRFGLIECDGAGGVLFRKEIGGLALPRQAGACPLWPLYRALGDPGRPVRVAIEAPDGALFAAFAIAHFTQPPSYDAPPPTRAAMAFTDDIQVIATLPRGAAPLKVGPHCSICPREACEARRAMFILG